MAASVGGRPPFYNEPEDLANAIDDYLINGIEERPIALGKQVVTAKVPTITGLCWHIGFESRQSFYDYELKPEFAYIVKRARLYIEKQYEALLQAGQNPSGPIFALKNMGWKDKTESEISGPNGGPIEVAGFNYLIPDKEA